MSGTRGRGRWPDRAWGRAGLGTGLGRRSAGGEVRRRPVRLARRRRRDLGGHDRRREVSARLLLRAAPLRRSVRRRPPEELHQADGRDGLRHPFRPLALGSAGGDRDHQGQRNLVACPARRLRAADRRRQRRRRLRRIRLRREYRRRPCGTSSPVSRRARPAIEDRLLCARLESNSCSLEQESWSAVRALTLTVEDGQVPVPGGLGRGRCSSRLEAGRPGASDRRRRRRRRDQVCRSTDRRGSRHADRVPLREDPRLRRSGGRRGCGPANSRSRRPRRSTRPAWPTGAPVGVLRDRLLRKSGLHRR